MTLWDKWKKGFDAWEDATAKYIEQVLKSPLVLGPSGRDAHGGDEDQGGRGQGQGALLGRDGPLHQARSGARRSTRSTSSRAVLDLEESVSPNREQRGCTMDITPYLELRIAPARHLRFSPRAPLARPLHAPDAGRRLARRHLGGVRAQQIRQIALFLAGAGLKSGDRACIFAPNRVEWMTAALGIQAAGGVMVPIYAASTPDQAAYVVEHSDAKVRLRRHAGARSRACSRHGTAYAAVERIVLLDDGLDAAKVLAELRAAGKKVPPYAEVEREARLLVARPSPWAAPATRRIPGAFERTMNAVSLDQPGMMLYTSGTSGNPKGVPAHPPQRRRQRARLAAVQRARSSHEGEVDLLWLPMSHIFGFGEACLGNTLGFTTYLVRSARRDGASSPRCAPASS